MVSLDGIDESRAGMRWPLRLELISDTGRPRRACRIRRASRWEGDCGTAVDRYYAWVPSGSERTKTNVAYYEHRADAAGTKIAKVAAERGL